jgi:rhodanese-related sulfurtransferase
VIVSELQPKSVEQMVAESEARIESLSPEQVAAEIGETNITLVDVREDDERFLEGAIPGSVHVPRGMLELSADPNSPLHRQVLDRGRRIIVYCSSGTRSALSAATFNVMGYENVAHLSGGMMAWKRGGQPVEQIPFA